jgi:hypothetical protein
MILVRWPGDYSINLIDQPALWRVWLDPAWRP